VILEARAITETKRKEILRTNLIPQVAVGVEVVAEIAVAVGAEAAVIEEVVGVEVAMIGEVVVVEVDVAVAEASAAKELLMAKTRNLKQTPHWASVFQKVELSKS
jgi:hypothetical protein